MKVIIKKDFLNYKANTVIEIDNTNYKQVYFWLRRLEEAQFDGNCERVAEKYEKEENMLQSKVKDKKNTKSNKAKE